MQYLNPAPLGVLALQQLVGPVGVHSCSYQKMVRGNVCLSTIVKMNQFSGDQIVSRNKLRTDKILSFVPPVSMHFGFFQGICLFLDEPSLRDKKMRNMRNTYYWNANLKFIVNL